MAVDEVALTDSLRKFEPAPEKLLAVELAPLLRDVVDAARAVLGVDAVGVLVLDEADEPRSAVATGPMAAKLEDWQEVLGIGPGIDALSSKQPVLIGALADVEWYAPLVDALGGGDVVAVMSVPIWAGSLLAGNLNLMRIGRHDWTAAETRAAQAYANVVATLLQFASMAQTGVVTPIPDGSRSKEEVQ